MELNMWNSSQVDCASFDAKSNTWAVQVTREGGEQVTLRPTQLVLATGMSGFPNMPEWPGMECAFNPLARCVCLLGTRA